MKDIILIFIFGNILKGSYLDEKCRLINNQVVKNVTLSAGSSGIIYKDKCPVMNLKIVLLKY